MTLRLSEVYVSVQGEGPRAGTPTTFVRFAGCNLKCPGWPCDTPHAIDPRIFEKEQRHLDPHELIMQTPDWPKSICLTGGEPFIQPKDELCEYVKLLKQHGYKVECFSNGTILYPPWALDQMPFIMDWKLPGSGEDPMNRNRITNASGLDERSYIKFVIADKEDYDTAVNIWEDAANYTTATFSYGAAWGKIETAELVEWALRDKLPWQLNVQVHNYIWDRDKRGI